MRRLLSLPCTIRIPGEDAGETDVMGEPIATPEEVFKTVCEVQQKSAEELRQGRSTIVSEFKAYFPPGTRLTAQARVEVGDVEYTVEGEPWVARHPRRKTVHHVEASLVVAK